MNNKELLESTQKKSIRYFNDALIGNSILDRSTSSEKIRLEFSLENCLKGFSYYIQARILDSPLDSFNSELIQCQNSEITFENFYMCDYIFECEQRLKVTIFKNNSIFVVNTNLASIVSRRGEKLSLPIDSSNKNKENILIKYGKIEKENSFIQFKFYVKCTENDNYFFNKMHNKIFYIIIYDNHKIYSSELISSKGTFEPADIPCCLLKPNPFTIIFLDYQNHKIKEYKKTITEMSKNKQDIIIPMKNNQKLIITDISELKMNYSFLDFIKAGVRIGLTIGIDFTGSNGHPLDSGTLHSKVDDFPNDYERAIKACGDIVAYYDYDQKFPVYGFGAKTDPNDYEANMCFNVNNENNPEIYLVDNIIEKYHECLDRLTFAGPTYFSPIINKVIYTIRENNNPLEYVILMILTDGVIDDLEETIDALVEGSFLPLSVIIIGIGDADFTNMEKLDGDEIPLISRKGVKRMRDLVQFVPFKRFENNEKKLALEVLEEIPRQILEYYNMNNYTPEKVRQSLSLFDSSVNSSQNYPSLSQIEQIKSINKNTNNDYLNNNICNYVNYINNDQNNSNQFNDVNNNDNYMTNTNPYCENNNNFEYDGENPYANSIINNDDFNNNYGISNDNVYGNNNNNIINNGNYNTDNNQNNNYTNKPPEDQNDFMENPYSVENDSYRIIGDNQ